MPSRNKTPNSEPFELRVDDATNGASWVGDLHIPDDVDPLEGTNAETHAKTVRASGSDTFELMIPGFPNDAQVIREGDETARAFFSSGLVQPLRRDSSTPSGWRLDGPPSFPSR
jgi:hypothetical protein